MIRFILERVAFKNVRSYQDEMMEMDFPINSLTVFTGHVGSGKSTIVKAISMALYGDDGGVKGEKLSIDDLVNEKTDKNLEIHLYIKSEDLINGETHQYEIHLYHKHTLMKSKLVLMKDTVDISGNGKNDTYKKIESIFVPSEVYHNVYYFTQQAKNFFTALQNSEQKQIFDNILSLKEYDDYYGNCDKVIKVLTQDLDVKRKYLEWAINAISIHNKAIFVESDSIENQKREDQNRIQALDFKISEVRRQIEVLELEVGELNKSDITEKLQTLIASHASIIATHKAHETELVSAIEAKKSEYVNRTTELVNEYRNKQKSLIDELKLEISSRLQKVNTRLNDLREKRNNTQSSIDKVISDIKQETLVKLNEISGEVQQVQLEIGKLKSLLDTKKLEAHKQAVDAVRVKESDMRELSVKVSRLEKTIEGLRTSIFDKNTEIINDKRILAQEISICTKCHQPLLDKAQYEKQIQENESKVLALESEVEQCTAELESHRKRIALLTNFIAEQERLYQESIRGMEDEYTQHKEILERKKRLLDQETVNQKVLATQKAQDICAPLKQERERLDSEIKVAEDEIASITLSEVESTGNIKKTVNEQYSSALTKLNLQSEDSTKELNSQKEAVKVNITVSEQQHNREVSMLREKLTSIDTVEKQIRTYKNSILEDTAVMSELQSKEYSEVTLNNLREELAKVTATNDQCEIETRDMEQELNILIFWKVGFSDSGIKSMLIDSAIPHMNECVRDELDRIAPGIFTVSFDTLSQTKAGEIRDKFQINILHNLKGTKGHKKLSGGEKRIIDLCCMSALRSLSEKLYGKMFCHIFYDEVLDALDSDCRQLFCQSTRLQSDSGRNVTLITHALPDDVEPDRIFPF